MGSKLIAIEEITFAKHIAPIIYNNCVTCHRPEGVGPFSLIDYQDVKRRSRQISEVVSSGYMPPWKPDESYGPKLIGERRLSSEQIELLEKWYHTGAKAGDLNATPEKPQFSSAWRYRLSMYLRRVMQASCETPYGTENRQDCWISCWSAR